MKSKSSIITQIIFIIFAFGAGTVNGLLGTGGGILLTYVISLTLRDKDFSPKDVFACSMVAIVPICIFSLFTYSFDVFPTVKELLCIIIPSVLGGLTGAILSDRLKSVILEKAFAILIIYAGIKMLLH